MTTLRPFCTSEFNMLQYRTVSCEKVTDTLIDEVKELFDTSYGFWSASNPPRAELSGRPIFFPRKAYLEYFRGSGDYVGECDLALCYDGEKLIGEAVYVNKETSRGKVALVVQLVVHKEYRRKGIGSALLYSIWGFSDYYAWGIVTSNPCTVMTLEKATSRWCSVPEIIQNKHFLAREVLSDIRFLDDSRDSWVINKIGSAGESRIRTGFATERSPGTEALVEIESRLGRIGPKDEWLAFTFKSQKINSDSGFRKMLDESNLIVRDAYARMNMPSQRWMAKADEEIDEILKLAPVPSSSAICDFGAGTGRHVKALIRRGFTNVMGIDFVLGGDGGVVQGDCRSWRGPHLFELIICLYDVIGSFRSESDNQQILNNIFANLKPGGSAVISVMNLDFAGMSRAKVVGNQPDELYKLLSELQPSSNMAETGEVFDGRFALVDRQEGIVYRKEQFGGDDKRLRRELVVVDRRFTLKTISRMCQMAGFNVLASRYTRSGFHAPSLFNGLRASRWGKEILLLLRKP